MVKLTRKSQQEQAPASWPPPSCRTGPRSKTSNPLDPLTSKPLYYKTLILTARIKSNLLIPMKNSDQLPRPYKEAQLSSHQPHPQMTPQATTPRNNLPSISRGNMSAASKQASLRSSTSATTVQRACLSYATWWTTSACTSSSNRTPATTAAKPGLPGATARTTWRSAHAWDMATNIPKT